jgi:hypothetical protein
MLNSFMDLTDEDSQPQFVDITSEQALGRESNKERGSPENHSHHEATQHHQEGQAQEDQQRDQWILAQQEIAQQDQQQDQQELSQQNLTQQTSPQQESLQPDISRQKSHPKSRQKSRKGQALDRELVKMRASLAEAHLKLTEQSDTLRLIYSICQGLERHVTVIVSGRLDLSGTSLSTDPPPINPIGVAETDASPADGGLTADLADDVPIDARQTDFDLTHTGTPMAVEACADTTAQTEMEENGNRRSRRKRPGNPKDAASKRTRRA